MKIKTLKIALLLSIFFGSTTFATASGIDHFSVKLSPNEVKVGEALDLEIEAVDKNDNIVTNYDGIILIFSESDDDVELPNSLEDNTYTFTESDQGKIKFENGVKFKKGGIQDIHVYDLDDDTVYGVAETNIIKTDKLKTIDISIVSPTNGSTIGEKTISISGTTQKNHNIEIIINGKDKIKTTSNEEGVFEKEITNLVKGENTIKANVLNSDNNIVGTSEEIKIEVNLNQIQVKNFKITPENITPENEIDIELITNIGLQEVNIILNDTLVKLKETEEGIYKAKTIAPNKSGIYKIDAILKDEFGHEKKELGIGSINVKEVELNTATEKKPAKKIEITKNDTNVYGLKLIKLKTKSILTWDKVKGVKSYNIYKKNKEGKYELFENVTKEKIEIPIVGDQIKYNYFAVKTVFENKENKIYEGNLSEATKVQTGPEILILLILSLFIGGLFIITSKRRA